MRNPVEHDREEHRPAPDSPADEQQRQEQTEEALAEQVERELGIDPADA